MKPANFTETVFFRAPPGTGAALAEIAAQNLTKPSEVLRQFTLNAIREAAAGEKIKVVEFIQGALSDGLGAQLSGDDEHGSRAYG